MPQDLAHTLRTRLADSPRFVVPKRPQHSFCVEHYAGRVTYATTYLLDKNKDFVVQEHKQLLSQSGSAFLRCASQLISNGVGLFDIACCQNFIESGGPALSCVAVASICE